jgi:hypothetical protein
MPTAKVFDRSATSQQNHQALLDALVIATAALRVANRNEEAAIADKAIYAATATPFQKTVRAPMSGLV